MNDLRVLCMALGGVALAAVIGSAVLPWYGVDLGGFGGVSIRFYDAGHIAVIGWVLAAIGAGLSLAVALLSDVGTSTARPLAATALGTSAGGVAGVAIRLVTESSFVKPGLFVGLGAAALASAAGAVALATTYRVATAALASIPDSNLIDHGGSEMVDTGSDPATAMKKCPACAESIRAEAVVCRYCGFDFGRAVMGTRPQQRTNGLAVASMVLGIVWVWWIGSVLALVFGYIARSQIDESRGEQSGRGMAIAGIVLGWVGVGGLIIVIITAASASTF